MEISNPTTSIAATTASNGTASSQAASHRKNAAQRNRSDSPYQGRTAQKDNPTQLIIKQAVDFLIQQVEAGKSETLAAYLSAMARFHNYSFGNIVAIKRQRPTATRVAGFGTWKEMGRFVKRGEKGIQILAPMIGYRRRNAESAQNSDADGNAKPQPTLIGLRAVYVFARLSRDLRPRFYALDVARNQWEAKLIIQGEQKPISCGNHHTSKSAAIDAAQGCARRENELAQSVFEQWVSVTKAKLSSEQCL
jgi:N-terminal domain of anti-restriction factor ArdC